MEGIDLSDFFKTKAQATDFTVRLATITQAVYRNDFNLEHELTGAFGLQKKDRFIALLRNSKIAVDSNAELTDFFTKLQEYVSQLPTLTLTLAFEPQEQTLKVLSDWFLLNRHTQVLFDITVDEKLIAGAAIQYQGKFLDFSIKPAFDRILADVFAGKTQAPVKTEAPVPTTTDAHQAQEHMSVGR